MAKKNKAAKKTDAKGANRSPWDDNKTIVAGVVLVIILILLFAVMPVGEFGLAKTTLKNQPEKTELTGKLVAIIFDDFENNKSETEYYLEQENGQRYNLKFREEPFDLTFGSTIKVSGIKFDKGIIVESENNVEKTIEIPPYTFGEQKTVVLLVNFLNDNRETYTISDVYSEMFTNPISTNFYYKENSFDQTYFAGDVFGWYTIPYDNSPCLYFDWADAADLKATQDGLDLEQYNRKVYVFPYGTPCQSTGELGGYPSRVWMMENSVNTYIHEIGHNLGNAHAASIHCGDKAIDDYSNCVFHEYGELYDVMGLSNNDKMGHFNAPHKVAMGWVPSERIQTVTDNGIYTIYELETIQSGIQTLKINKPDTSEFYYIEYKQPIGFDWFLPENITRGVLIHIWDDLYYHNTYFIDTTPRSIPGYYYDDLADAALADGASFYDHINGIRITQVSHDENTVTVDVKLYCSDGTKLGQCVNQGTGNPPPTYCNATGEIEFKCQLCGGCKCPDPETGFCYKCGSWGGCYKYVEPKPRQQTEQGI